MAHNTAQTKKQAMVFANLLVKQTGCTRSGALTTGWQAARLLNDLVEAERVFTFEKGNGEMRTAHGTRASGYAFTNETAKTLAIPYYDLGADAVRSFRIDRVDYTQTINPEIFA